MYLIYVGNYAPKTFVFFLNLTSWKGKTNEESFYGNDDTLG